MCEMAGGLSYPLSTGEVFPGRGEIFPGLMIRAAIG